LIQPYNDSSNIRLVGALNSKWERQCWKVYYGFNITRGNGGGTGYCSGTWDAFLFYVLV